MLEECHFITAKRGMFDTLYDGMHDFRCATRVRHLRHKRIPAAAARLSSMIKVMVIVFPVLVAGRTYFMASHSMSVYLRAMTYSRLLDADGGRRFGDACFSRTRGARACASQ